MAGKITLNIDEFNNLKKLLKEKDVEISKLVKRNEYLQEIIAVYNDAITYISNLRFTDRIFKWKKICSEINNNVYNETKEKEQK